MAYTTSTLLLALILVATASVVHCTVVFGGQPVIGINVEASVTCMSTGEGAADVPVSVSFDGGKTTVAAGVTDDCGVVFIDVPTNIGVNILDADIIAKVPFGTCSATAPARVVTSRATLTGTVVTPGGVKVTLGCNTDI